MHLEGHDTPDRLADRIRVQPRARVTRRLMAIRLAMLGRTAARVAAEVPLTERQVRTWVARYNADGIPAPVDRTGHGRKGRSHPLR